MREGSLFSFKPFLALWISFGLGFMSTASPSQAPRKLDRAERTIVKHAPALQLVLTSRGAPPDGARSSAGFSETQRLGTQLKAGAD